MKKNFLANGKKMICLQASDITLILTKSDYQSRMGNYIITLIAIKSKIYTQTTRGHPYKKQQQLMKDLQKNYPIHFGYTIRQPNDEYSSDLGFQYALHNYNSQEE